MRTLCLSVSFLWLQYHGNILFLNFLNFGTDINLVSGMTWGRCNFISILRSWLWYPRRRAEELINIWIKSQFKCVFLVLLMSFLPFLNLLLMLACNLTTFWKWKAFRLQSHFNEGRAQILLCCSQLSAAVAWLNIMFTKAPRCHRCLRPQQQQPLKNALPSKRIWQCSGLLQRGKHLLASLSTCK